MGTKEKLESEVTEFFNEYTAAIISKIEDLVLIKQMNIAFDLGVKYRIVCSEIGRDPRFTYMIKFKELVRGKDREMMQRLEDVDAKREEDKGVKPSEVSMESLKPLYKDFYKSVDKIQSQLLQNMEENPEDEFIFYLNKSKLLLKNRLIGEFTPEQEKAIEAFRKNLSEVKRMMIQKPLTVMQELRLFDEYRLAVEYQLVDLEDKGWYNSVRLYCKAWIKYLRKIAVFHESAGRERVSKKVMEEVEKVNDWMKRVEKKYDKRILLNVEQTKLLSDQYRDMILRYRDDRKILKKYEEDKQILKMIK